MTQNAEKVRRYEGWEFVGWLSALVPGINPADDVTLYRRRAETPPHSGSSVL